MRALLAGTVLLAIAALLPGWEPAIAPAWRGAVDAAPPRASPDHVVAGGVQVPAPREAHGLSSAAASPGPAPAAATRNAGESQRTAAAGAGTQRTARPGADGVRRFTPGSKAHAGAIESVIASEDYRDSVAPLARLYLATFLRAPDHGGLGHYVAERDAGTPLDAIAEEFALSREFEARYGELDNAAFVERLHRNAGAAPEWAAQREHWIAELDAGTMTRGEVMLAFSESARFRAQSANAVFVALAYAETLGRGPDAGELARGVAFLEAGHAREALIRGLLDTRRGR